MYQITLRNDFHINIYEMNKKHWKCTVLNGDLTNWRLIMSRDCILQNDLKKNSLEKSKTLQCISFHKTAVSVIIPDHTRLFSRVNFTMSTRVRSFIVKTSLCKI